MINLCLCAAPQSTDSAKPGRVRPAASLPVDYAFAVEEEEADCYLCSIKPVGGEKKRGGGRTHYWLLSLSENWPKVFSERSEGMGLGRVMKGRVTK